MSRPRLLTALVLVGLLLALLYSACNAEQHQPTPQETSAYPTNSSDEISDLTAELPLPAESLKDAERAVREFTAIYLHGWPEHASPTSSPQLQRLTTNAFATELSRSPAAKRANRTSPTATIARLKIRFLAATSIQYEIDTQLPPADQSTQPTEQAEYAITVVLLNGSWKVDGLQPATAGNDGATPP